MRIGVIGAGRVGGTLARRLARAGNEVVIANSRGPETLRGLVERLDGRLRAGTAREAARFGELVIAAVPFGRHAELPADELAGKPVVDTSNYDPRRDGPHPQLDRGSTTSSELVQACLPGAYVIKAFNTMSWEHLRDYGRQSSAMSRYAMPVAGDRAEAKRLVFDLVEQLGFEPVDAGDLATGGRRQRAGETDQRAAGDDRRVDGVDQRAAGVDRPGGGMAGPGPGTRPRCGRAAARAQARARGTSREDP